MRKCIVDPVTGSFLWQCPACRKLIQLESELAVRLATQAGRCQGCRAAATFKGNPGLIGVFLDFWVQTDVWPQSDSWLEALQRQSISLLGASHAEVGAFHLPGSGDQVQPKRTE